MSIENTPTPKAGCQPIADDWLTTCLGEYLQSKEQVLFDEAVIDIFGFNAVQVGMLKMDLLRNSRIPNAIQADTKGGDVRCDSMQLPFQSNTIDLLLLPHGLDFSQNPQQTLREAERVLMPEGHIMLTGFNPFSLWGLKRMLRRRNNFVKSDLQETGGASALAQTVSPLPVSPWNSSFLSLLRVRDWLDLLGFELVEGNMTCYTPPFSSHKSLQRFKWMDKAGERLWPMMGGVYFVVAKKRVVGMRLIRPNWNKAKFKPGLVVTPTQKNKGNHCQQNNHFTKDRDPHEQ